MTVRARVALAMTLTSLIVVVRGASAQVPDTLPESQQQQPPPPHWEGTASLSVALQAGVSDSRTISISGEAFRRAAIWSYAVQGDHTHSSVKLDGPDYQAVADSQNFRFTAQRDLRKQLYFVVRPAFKRNEVQAVDYRVEELVGLGVELLEKPRAQLDVLGTVGALQQEKNVDGVEDNDGVWGGLQTSQFGLGGMWRLTQMGLFLRPFKSDQDYRLQFQVALVGAVKGPVEVNISYSLDRENLVAGGSERSDRRLSIGLQLNFGQI